MLVCLLVVRFSATPVGYYVTNVGGGWRAAKSFSTSGRNWATESYITDDEPFCCPSFMG